MASIPCLLPPSRWTEILLSLPPVGTVPAVSTILRSSDFVWFGSETGSGQTRREERVFPEQRARGDERLQHLVVNCCVSRASNYSFNTQSRNHVITNPPKSLPLVLRDIKPKCRIKTPKLQCKIIYKKVSVFNSYQMNALPQEKLH